MNLENLPNLAYGIIFALIGTAFLMQYLQFQRLIDKITKMGEETFGKIISIEVEKYPGRYRPHYHRVVRILFEADGETVVPPSFTVSLDAPFYVGQELYVQYFRYNPEECLIKEYPESSWYMNRVGYFGGTLGLMCASISYILALILLISAFM